MESSKDQFAVKLMGALLVRLSGREGIKQVLKDFEGVPQDELIEELLGEFEKIVERRWLEHLVDRELEAADAHAPDSRPEPEQKTRPETGTVTPVKNIETPAADLPVDVPPAPEQPQLSGEPLPTTMKSSKAQNPSRERQDRPKKPASARPDPPRGRGKASPPPVPPAAAAEHGQVPAPRHQPRTPVDLKDEDSIYFHAVMLLPPDENQSPKPFMLEEKGIEGKEFAFALDRGGLRFFLSTLRGRSMNVSKTGVLLLNKQESIRLHGTHASILNDLRAHGILLPFAFGTVAVGRDEVYRKIEEHHDRLYDAARAQAATTWWDLSVFALDSRLAEFLTPEGMTGRRERDKGRESYTISGTIQKLDIKMLEKILGKEKKLAEGIHEELKAIADRADIDSMVSFGSGSSDDWKLILKSSYELPSSRVQWFCRTLTDLQYRHFLLELMLVLDGAQEPFVFPTA